MERLRSQKKDIWLQVDLERILLKEHEDSLASKVAVVYHDSIAPDAPRDDGFEEETALMEAKIEQHMLDPSSEEDTDTDTGVEILNAKPPCVDD